MQDIEHSELINKLCRILATLNDDIHKNKLAHQQEIEQLQKIIKDQQQEIDKLRNVVKMTEEIRRVKKKSMDDCDRTKPLFARKRSAILAQLTVEIPQPPKHIYPVTTKNQPLSSYTSLSSICNSKQKLVSKNTSHDKYELKSSREKKSSSKIKDQVSDKKYYGISKKIQIKNKENKEPIASQSKTLSSSSTSRGKLVKLFFQRGHDNLKQKPKEDRSQLIWSKGSQNPSVSSQQQKKFINIYIPSKVPNEKREWR